MRDPELIKHMAIKDFDHFEDHRSFLDDNMDELFGNSLFMLKGSKWRDMRATLSPAFTGSKMRQMFELVSDCAKDMSNYFVKQAVNGQVLRYEMKDIFSKYSNDVIASCAFGYKVNSVEDTQNDFYVTGKRFMNITGVLGALRLFLLRTVPAVMKLLDIQFIEKKVSIFFKSMVMDTIAIREEKNIFRPDIINLLMNVRKGIHAQPTVEDKNSNDGFATVEESHVGKATVKREWTDNEIVAQCFLFFLAGFDTASTMLSFTFYELAINPDIQQRLYDEIAEIDSKLNGKQIDYDVLQKMKYLDQVISESLRKWPPAALTDRLCSKEYTFESDDKKFIIEKGQSFWIPIHGLHHDPNYYSEPEKFDPERFSDENRGRIIHGTYIPFGTGPRNCIGRLSMKYFSITAYILFHVRPFSGSRFALMEIKAIIYYMLLKFKMEPNENTQIPLKYKKQPITISTERGIHLTLNPRQ